jgi:hypothetical protein
MMEIYVVLAIDQTGYKLVRTFSSEEKAKSYKKDLIELLWKVTIYKTILDA